MAAVYKSLSGDGPHAGSEGKPKVKNAQRVLILSSRGVNSRHRHLLNDLATLLPHGRREVKFDSKKHLNDLNELAELYNCNNVMFFEARKHQDLYMHVAKVPNGPTAKFHIQNLHTMAELHFVGNSLKGSRPILSFDAAFESDPHLRLIKELLSFIFVVPQGTRKSKPFVDRVMGFSIVDGKIWVRNYQISEEDAAAEKKIDLLEIGPRFCMTPITIQEGSFGGPIIYQNKQFVSPNQVRADLRKQSAMRHGARKQQGVERSAHKDRLALSTGSHNIRPDALDSRQVFA